MMTRQLRIIEPAKEHFNENVRELRRHLDWLNKQPKTELIEKRIRITKLMLDNKESVLS